MLTEQTLYRLRKKTIILEYEAVTNQNSGTTALLVKLTFARSCDPRHRCIRENTAFQLRRHSAPLRQSFPAIIRLNMQAGCALIQPKSTSNLSRETD